MREPTLFNLNFTHIRRADGKDVTPMCLTVQEMTVLCVFHDGTVSKTLELLRNAENEPPERMAVIEKLITALTDMPTHAISLAFDPED